MNGMNGSSGQRSLMRIFRWPLLLAVATLIGLLSALIGDGLWDGISWTLLVLPVLSGFYLGWRSPTIKI